MSCVGVQGRIPYSRGLCYGVVRWCRQQIFDSVKSTNHTSGERTSNLIGEGAMIEVERLK